MNFNKSLSLVVLSLGVLGTVACSQAEDVSSSSAADTVSSSASSSGSVPRADLYTRLGGDANVDVIATAAVRNLLADPSIAATFATRAAGAPTENQFKLCFRNVLKRNTTDPKIDDYRDPSKNDGYNCPDLAIGFAPYHLSHVDFVRAINATAVAFVAHAPREVAPYELNEIFTLLAGTERDVVH